MNELQELLAKAQWALSHGAKQEDVDAWVSRETKGRYASLQDIPQPEKPKSSKLGLIRPYASGALFHLADDLSGLTAAFAHGSPTMPNAAFFPSAKQDYQQAEAQTRQDYPTASKVAEGAGMLTSAVATGGAMAPAEGAGLMGMVGRGAIAGGGAGVFQSAGDSETLSELPGNVLHGGTVGAAVGAILGPATGLVAELFGGLGGLMRRIFSPKAAEAAATKKALLRALEAAGLTPQAAQAKLAQLEAVAPGQAVVADASPTLQRELRASLNKAPALEEPVRETLGARQAGQAERLASGLERDMGVPAAAGREAQAAAQESLPSLAQRVYDPLENTVVKDGPGVALLKEVFSNPDARPIVVRARPAHASGPVTFGQLQAIRQDIADEVGKAFSSGAGELGKRLRLQLDKFTDGMEQIFPGFRQANEAYRRAATLAGKSGSAFDLGAEAVNHAAADVDLTLRTLQARGGQEAADAYRMGFVTRVTTELRSLQTGRNAAMRFAEMGPDTEQKLRLLFPTRSGFESFLKRARTERTFAATKNAALGNSTTAQQSADLGMTLSDLATGHSVRHSLARTAEAAMAGGSFPRAVGSSVGRSLMLKAGPAATRLFDLLAEASQSAGRRQRLMGAVPGSAATLGGALFGRP